MPPPKDPIKREEWRSKLSDAKKGERHPLFGKHQSDEWKHKQSTSKKGKYSGPDSFNFGKPLMESTRRKLSEINKGKHLSEETCKKISESHKGKYTGENSHNYGKRLSEETRARISKANGGKSRSEEIRKERKESHVGGFWYGAVRYFDGPQYCEKWNEDLRERVRAFFGYRCVECGAPQNGRKLAVHHVWYNKKACCDDTPRSLVPLCISCHIKSNSNREYWSEHFQKIIDTKHDGICWLTSTKKAGL